jgi:hypothetical protein
MHFRLCQFNALCDIVKCTLVAVGESSGGEWGRFRAACHVGNHVVYYFIVIVEW